MRAHDKKCFYKFMTCDTAEIVLKTKKFRWREPSQFNDPFDHQFELSIPYTEGQFFTALRDKFMKVVLGGEKFEVKEETVLSAAFKLLKKSQGRISKDELVSELENAIKETSHNISEYEKKLNETISSNLNCSRVFCVSESNENVVMWSHYADSHKGVCIRLQCIDELDNVLLAAKPVKYTKGFPVLPSLDEHIDSLTGENPLDYASFMYELPYIKHEDWSYEKEWRIHEPHAETPNNDGYSDYIENEKVFGAIYLGCNIEPANASKLVNYACANFKQMEVYQAKKSKNNFNLEFEKVL